MKKMLVIFTLIFGSLAHAYNSEEGLQAAWSHENNAIIAYTEIINKFGYVKPFVNILRAEYRHRRFVEMVATKLDISLNKTDTYVPPDYTSLQEACEAGIKAEMLNIELYDKMISEESNETVLNLFYKLRADSLNNHLPAFQRCAKRLSKI